MFASRLERERVRESKRGGGGGVYERERDAAHTSARAGGLHD